MKLFQGSARWLKVGVAGSVATALLGAAVVDRAQPQPEAQAAAPAQSQLTPTAKAAAPVVTVAAARTPAQLAAAPLPTHAAHIAPASFVQQDDGAEVVAERVKPAFPVLNLGEPAAQGDHAIKLLGRHLPEVAAYYGLTAAQLTHVLRNDPAQHLDNNGRLYVVDDAPNLAPGELEKHNTRAGRVKAAGVATTGANASLIDGSYAPLEQTFLLHSKPGSSRTIYLNFKGATLKGTVWNRTSTVITAKPFDLDGAPDTFSTNEQQVIQGIWQSVAEDFAPFDVDITTEAPPVDALSRSNLSDKVFGTTVLITDNNGVYSCSCGGISYNGSFDDYNNYYKPALVFYNRLAGAEKYIAEAVSHEAGHTVGLLHDGSASTSYYGGQGSGATGWAPIMGNSYYRALSQWNRGEYAGANNLQKDTTVMQTYGLPLRTDDHGNTVATAAALLPTSTVGAKSNFSVIGVISTPSDVDVFGLNSAAGTITVNVNPAARSPNLDVLAKLMDANGNVLATSNPADALNASITFTAPAAGRYFVSVQGTGKGDPLVDGYTNYGSLGQYVVNVTAPATAP